MPGGEGLDDLDAAIGRAVVDDDDFGQRLLLRPRRREQLGDELGFVATGNDDRDGHTACFRVGEIQWRK